VISVRVHDEKAHTV